MNFDHVEFLWTSEEIEKNAAQSEGQKHGGPGADDGGNAIGPDLPCLHRRQPMNARGLQPMDSGGLLVARLVLKADIDGLLSKKVEFTEFFNFQHNLSK